MTTYQIAQAHDNAAGLADANPQPASDGIQYPRRTFGASEAYDDGAAYTVWRYSNITPTQYATLLSDFGLTSEQANVTIKTTDAHSRSFVNRNGVVIRPKGMRYRDGVYYDVEFVIKELESL